MQVINSRGAVASPATYTVDEVAALLGISRGMAYAFVNDGVIPAKRIGRRWVVARAAFHVWLNESDNLPKAG
ncbi:helix-turn-helix domain-containing protein [Nocardia sp. NPDC002869]|uniref:helix-turn-helix domain-containing protein n=1 Tax=Nocardia sp. NPDC002869 TaxID=3161032 RepID=UPI00398CA9DE